MFWSVYMRVGRRTWRCSCSFPAVMEIGLRTAEVVVGRGFEMEVAVEVEMVVAAVEEVGSGGGVGSSSK